MAAGVYEGVYEGVFELAAYFLTSKKLADAVRQVRARVYQRVGWRVCVGVRD